MSEHLQMAEEVYSAIHSVGRRMAPTIAGLGPRDPTEVAENSSEFDATSASGQKYIIIVIRADD